eukprot:3930863-Amphidinium_carterae.1
MYMVSWLGDLHALIVANVAHNCLKVPLVGPSFPPPVVSFSGCCVQRLGPWYSGAFAAPVN